MDMRIGTDSNSTAGLVEYVSPTADASSGTFKIKISSAESESRLARRRKVRSVAGWPSTDDSADQTAGEE